MSILYSKMQNHYNIEKNMILCLSYCPGGLTLTDIEAIVKLHPDHFGNWKEFLDQSFCEHRNGCLWKRGRIINNKC